MSEHKDIKTNSVTSSQIAAIGHEGDTLRVVFTRGGTYDYANVSAEQYEKFKSADSIGSFFHRNIKPSHPCTKIG